MHYRMRLKSNWRGMVDGEEKFLQAGEEADVDFDTYKALCFDREIAEPVPIEEIETQQAKPKAKPKPRGRPKAQKPAEDKMIKTGENKD